MEVGYIASITVGVDIWAELDAICNFQAEYIVVLFGIISIHLFLTSLVLCHVTIGGLPCYHRFVLM